MGDYHQMQFDVRLESDRELEENIVAAIEFAHDQVKLQYAGTTTKNRYEGYGILAQMYAEANACLRNIKGDMSSLLASLKIDESAAVNAIASLDNSLTSLIVTAVKMSAQAKRVNEDLYALAALTKTPVEEYLEDADEDGFAETEDNSENEEDEDNEEE